MNNRLKKQNILILGRGRSRSEGENKAKTVCFGVLILKMLPPRRGELPGRGAPAGGVTDVQHCR